MSQRVRSAVAAAYLLLCILLGGSAQGVWQNLALQLFGIALVVISLFARQRSDSADAQMNIPLVLLICGLLLVLLQLIPLPADIWTALPGRSGLAQAYVLLGERPPALPVSVAPFQSVTALMAFIPAVATFAAVRLLRPSPRVLAVAVIVGMVCSLALGALQVAGGKNAWTLYPITNGGAVGVFANRNHMATLLLVSIPFGAALLASSSTERGGSRQARAAIGIAALVLIIVGIGLNASLAALALSLPVLLASVTILPAAAKWRGLALPVALVALIGGVFLLAMNPVGTTGLGAESSVQSRTEIWEKTSQAGRDSFPVGTGLGTFEGVYRQFEDPAAVTAEYVNHAHNDYLELALELGAPGILLIVIFLGWWVVTAVHIWTSPLSTPFGRAATIASAAILAHSIVDFPARTAAIAAIFASAVALMAQRLRMHSAGDTQAATGARHVKLG